MDADSRRLAYNTKLNSQKTSEFAELKPCIKTPISGKPPARRAVSFASKNGASIFHRISLIVGVSRNPTPLVQVYEYQWEELDEISVPLWKQRVDLGGVLLPGEKYESTHLIFGKQANVEEMDLDEPATPHNISDTQDVRTDIDFQNSDSDSASTSSVSDCTLSPFELGDSPLSPQRRGHLKDNARLPLTTCSDLENHYKFFRRLTRKRSLEDASPRGPFLKRAKPPDLKSMRFGSNFLPSSPASQDGLNRPQDRGQPLDSSRGALQEVNSREIDGDYDPRD